jgi:20S proteasome subunit alpha 6
VLTYSQFTARSNIPGRIRTRSSQTRLSSRRSRQQETCRPNSPQGLSPSFPSLSHHLQLTLPQRNAEELSSYQKKVIGVDDHLGVALAGLASDARVLSNFMKQQSLASKMTYGRAIPVERIVSMIGDRAQTNTQHYGKRPYGVGLLVAGVDETGPHLFEFSPSGMTQEMLACAIGARSQMARTYLERHLDKFAESGREELIKHALSALKESLAQDKELTVDNTSLAIIGIGEKDGRKKLEAFKLYDGQEISPLLESIAETSAAESGDAMETDS